MTKEKVNAAKTAIHEVDIEKVLKENQKAENLIDHIVSQLFTGDFSGELTPEESMIINAYGRRKFVSAVNSRARIMALKLGRTDFPQVRVSRK